MAKPRRRSGPPPLRTRVASFNLLNLVLPEVTYYQRLVYSRADYRRKIDWVAHQLRELDADVVGFQEVFHLEALLEAVGASKSYGEGGVLAPSANGEFPAVGLATRLPLLSWESIADFPPEGCLDLEGSPIPITRFSRPVLRATVELPNGVASDVFVCHLKSKRPMVPDDRDPHDPRERALGKARSLILRAAESAALRTLVLASLKGSDHPVIVLGDVNDGETAVTTELLAGTPPWRSLPPDVKSRIWDVLLYPAREALPRLDPRDVFFTHIHNGRHDTLDQILVSQEFVRQHPRHIGAVETVRVLNDHLVDRTFSDEPAPVWRSDHGQVVVTFKLRPPEAARGERPPRRGPRPA